MSKLREFGKSLLDCAVIGFLIATVIYKLPFVINETASIPLGVYIAVPGEIRNGDYVLYEPEEWIHQLKRDNDWVKPDEPDLPFIKKAITAGHRYTIDKHTASFIVDGRYIGQIYRDDNKGHKMPELEQGSYIVPNGKCLPVGEADRSFDGRYTGVVSKDRIIHRIVPVITWPLS